MSLAEVAGGARLGDGRVEDVGLQVVLAADVDERAVRAGRVGRDDHALDEHVRGLLHQLAVLERAGLGLVGVAHEVLVHRALGQEGRLLAHREARAAAAAQAGAGSSVEHRPRAAMPSALRSARSRRGARRRRACAGRARRCPGRGAGSITTSVRASAVDDSFAGRAASPAAPPARRGSARRRRHLVDRDRPDVGAVDETIGAMSHAPRHSNSRRLMVGSSPTGLEQGLVAARRRRAASTRCSCTRRRGARPTGWVSSMS